MPLNERQKTMLLKDISGVIQQFPKASDTHIPGKLPKARNLFVSDSVISERVLPTQPSPSPSQNIPISQPPPTQTVILDPITETPKVYETQLHQQQQEIPQTPLPSQLHSSPIPPPSLIVYAPHTETPNITTPKRSPSRYSGNSVSEGSSEGMLNFKPEPEVSDSERSEVILSLLPFIYGPDPHPTIIDISVRIPS